MSGNEHPYDRALPYVYSDTHGQIKRGRPQANNDECLTGVIIPLVNWDTVYNYQLVKRLE